MQLTMSLSARYMQMRLTLSGTRQPLQLKISPLYSTVIYPKSGQALLYTPMTGEMEMP